MLQVSPTLGRWVVVDLDAEETDQESWTTYQFGLNNAVRYNDFDGRQAGPDDNPIGDDFLVLSSWAYSLGTDDKYQAQMGVPESALAKQKAGFKFVAYRSARLAKKPLQESLARNSFNAKKPYQ